MTVAVVAEEEEEEERVPDLPFRFRPAYGLDDSVRIFNPDPDRFWYVSSPELFAHACCVETSVTAMAKDETEK